MADEFYLKLFHATLDYFTVPDLSKSRDATDFGRGFYTTMNIDQAIDWGRKRGHGKENFTVNAYHYFPSPELRIKSFSEPDEEWLETVYKCRSLKEKLDFDVVIGPVADDAVLPALREYFMPRETAKNPKQVEHLRLKAIEKLKISNSFDQFAFITETGLSHLKFYNHWRFSPDGKTIGRTGPYQTWKDGVPPDRRKEAENRRDTGGLSR